MQGYAFAFGLADRCAMLRQHGIRFRRVFGYLQAEDIYTVTRNGKVRTGRSWATVESMNRAELLAWLGY